MQGARLSLAHADAVAAAGRQPARGVPEALRPGRHRRGARRDPAETGSILDRVKGQAARLQTSLGVRDRVVVSDYLDSVREIERRVQMASQPGRRRAEIPDAPVGIPNDITEHFKLMFDLMALAFQADITRVITFSMDREASMRTYTNLGIAEAFHPLSHHGNNPEKQAKLVQIQRYHTEVFAKFIERLSKAKEADGTVLDHSTILFGSNMSNSDKHNNDPLPSAVLGHAHGQDQGRPAPEVSAGLALRRSAGDAVRPEQHPGREARRQRRHPLRGLAVMQSCAYADHRASRRARGAWRRRRHRGAAERRLLDAVERGDRAAALRLLAKGADAERARARMAPRPSCGPRRTTTSSWSARSIKAGADVKREEPASARPRWPKRPSSARRRSSMRCSRRAPIPTSRIPKGRRR